MLIPRNSEEMKKQAYRFLELGVCDACGQMVEWWMTPKHKQIPINVMYTSKWPAEAHWEENCQLKAKLKKETKEDTDNSLRAEARNNVAA